MLEDWDLWLRLIGRHQFVYIPKPLPIFRKSPTQVAQQPEKFLHIHMMCVDHTLLKNVRLHICCGSGLPAADWWITLQGLVN